MSVIHIRNLADAPQHVEEVSRSGVARADGYSLEDIVYRTRHAMRRRGVPQMLVAEETARPSARSPLGNHAKTRQDLTPWLAALYIRLDCRGRHIGRQLQAACIETARAIGTYDKLYLITKHEHYYEILAGFSLNRFPPETARRTRVLPSPALTPLAFLAFAG